MTESKARQFRRELHIAARIPIPPDALEPTDGEREVMREYWERYEARKERLDPMTPREYQEAVRGIL